MRKQTTTMVEKNSQEMNSRLIKVKGYKRNIVTGDNPQNLTIPSDGSQLLGIAFNKSIDATFGLNVNNEIVHENITMIFAVPSPLGALGLQPYFPINRKLKGRDDITVSINSAVNDTISYVIYYK